MADASTLPAIPFPTGQTTAQLYNWATSTSANLRRILQTLGGGDVDLTALQADVSTLQTEVSDIQQALADLSVESGWTPQRTFEHSLITRADEILGSFAALRSQVKTKFEQNADATMQAAIQAAKANTGVRTTVRVMNEQNLALAERIDQVNSALGVTNSSVTDLTQAVSDGDNALATRVTDVETTVAGNTQGISQTLASVNAMQAYYALTYNDQGEITDIFRLDGTPQGVGAVFNVDSFIISGKATSGGAPVQAFGIDFVNGVPQIALRGTVVADGTILARMIQAGAITADKISANALSAISANLGTVTAGLIKDSGNVYNFDLPNGVIKRTDGTMTIDFKNKTLDITF